MVNPSVITEWVPPNQGLTPCSTCPVFVTAESTREQTALWDTIPVSAFIGAPSCARVFVFVGDQSICVAFFKPHWPLVCV